MKVLMINSVCGIRSTGRICTDLATAFERQGHEVKIAYGRENVPEQFQKYAIRIGSDLDNRLHGLKARLLDGSGFGSKKATIEFLKWVNEFNPDVIHLHNLHGYYINIELLFDYLRECGKKVIWTLHDCWAFTGHSAFCDAAGCERWKFGCNHCPEIGLYPKSYTDRSRTNWERKKIAMQSVPNLSIVTPSKWLAGLVKDSFLSEYPVKVIYNGIDTTQFYPMKNDFRETCGIKDKFVLLGVSTTWEDRKSLSDFIELSKRLGDPYQIILVGVTHEQKKLLPDRIITIEPTNSAKELEYICNAADLLLDLSYCKSFPLTNFEAMGCTAPLLTYKVLGKQDTVKEHVDVVVEQGDVDAVAKEIEKYRAAISKKSELDLLYEGKSKKSTVVKNQQMVGEIGYWKYKRTLGVIGKKVLLGVASVWDRRKGLPDIIKLAEKIDQDTQIIVVGITSEQKKKLPDNIIGITHTANVSELQRLYAIADYFINPTYEDNFPSTNIEALACGTPVVTYHTGGSIEAADCVAGVVVEKGNYKMLNADKLISMNLCREQSKLFTKEVMASHYLNYLQD